MTARALVVIDYQNVHLTAHDKFAPRGTPKHESLIHPLHFANQVIQTRNNRLRVEHTAGKFLTVPTVELGEVNVYRGLPSNKHDPKAYRRSQAQMSEWTRDPRVNVTLRPLRYYYDAPTCSYLPREKGVDVLVALRVVEAALSGQFDAVIMASHDTDLEPALEAAQGKGCSVEVAGWDKCKKLLPRDWSTLLDPPAFVRSRDRKNYT